MRAIKTGNLGAMTLPEVLNSPICLIEYALLAHRVDAEIESNPVPGLWDR